MARSVDFVRENGPESLLDLADHDYVRAKNLAAVFLRFTIARLQTAVADPDSETVKDVWNMRVFGFRDALDFLAPDPALAAGDGQAVGPGDAAAVGQGRRASPRWRCCRDRRRLDPMVEWTTACSDAPTSWPSRIGWVISRPPGNSRSPKAGLPEDFVLGRRNRVPRPAHDPAGKALPELVMDQLLSDDALQRLEDRNGPEWRALVELQAAVGRRTAEVCGLAWDCLDYDERTDEDGVVRSSPALVHDMPKVGVVGCRLPVTEAEATLIRSQQHRAALRYPTMPTTAWRCSRRPPGTPMGTRR